MKDNNILYNYRVLKGAYILLQQFLYSVERNVTASSIYLPFCVMTEYSFLVSQTCMKHAVFVLKSVSVVMV